MSEATVETQPPAEGTSPPPDQAFPPNTPWRDMEPAQQVAYWQAQSRKHEERASSRQDYDDLKAERDALRQSSMTEAEKAAESARLAVEQARAEARELGRAEALKESNAGTVTALLDGALRIRGKSDDQVADALRYVNTDAFVTDGAPDTKAILAFAESIAGPVTGRTPDFGAGNRGNTPGLSQREQGLAQAEKRFGKKPE